MPSSPEFLKFASGFHQDLFDLQKPGEDVIDTVLQGLTKEEAQELRRFLSSLLESELSNTELVKIWNSSQADFLMPNDRNIRMLYRMIIEKIPK